MIFPSREKIKISKIKPEKELSYQYVSLVSPEFLAGNMTQLKQTIKLFKQYTGLSITTTGKKAIDLKNLLAAHINTLYNNSLTGVAGFCNQLFPSDTVRKFNEAYPTVSDGIECNIIPEANQVVITNVHAKLLLIPNAMDVIKYAVSLEYFIAKMLESKNKYSEFNFKLYKYFVYKYLWGKEAVQWYSTSTCSNFSIYSIYPPSNYLNYLSNINITISPINLEKDNIELVRIKQEFFNMFKNVQTY